MSTPSHATHTHDFMIRLHRVLSSAELDCQCRTALDSTLNRFSVLESRRQVRQELRHARRERDRIATLLRFLTELDEITEREANRTVFEEMASLFDEAGACAAEAAGALREVDAVRHRDTGGRPG